MKVLYLTEWYPHRYDAMSGLFVRKHAAAAVRAGADVCVLYLLKDTSIRRIERISQITDGIHEIYIYYPSSYLSALREGWRMVREQWGKPDVCQLNVITKNALLPLWLKRRYHIPYIIIEHWTGYLDRNPDYRNGSCLHRWLAERTAREAETILCVSSELMHAMQACGLRNNHWHVLNNVVDDFFYDLPLPHKPNKHFQLLHISCFDEPHKNVKGLLRAVKKVAAERTDFRLTIAGTGVDFEDVRRYADTLSLPDDLLRWTGELPPEQIAEAFATADAFVLFSNYETAGVVLAESLASGTPILSTPVGIAPEVVNDKTGILVPIGDEDALAQTIIRMINRSTPYDAPTIRTYGRDFSYQQVGAQLMHWYEQARRS